jgi:hypothetical protein
VFFFICIISFCDAVNDDCLTSLQLNADELKDMKMMPIMQTDHDLSDSDYDAIDEHSAHQGDAAETVTPNLITSRQTLHIQQHMKHQNLQTLRQQPASSSKRQTLGSFHVIN